MVKANIAVFVSGGGTNLQALLDAADRGELKDGALALVLSSQEDAYALERAKKHHIPTKVVSKKQAGSQQAFEAEILRTLEEYSVDMIVLAGFMSILSADFTRRYEKRIINVHPSLIPAFCGEGYYGLRVHEAALTKGVKVTGATVHYVNEVPDGGEIIFQKAVRVLQNDTPQTLQRRVMEQAEWKLLPRAAQEVAKKIAKGKEKKL